MIKHQEEESMFDEITGEKKRHIMEMLNKEKLSKYEMDELFGTI